MKKLSIVFCLIVLTARALAQICGDKNYEALSLQSTKAREEQALTVVSRLLRSIQDHDGKTFGSLLDSGMVWHQPGGNRLSGVKISRNQVFQMAGLMNELSAHTLTLSEIKSVSVSGNHVACLLHWKAAQPTGVVLDVDNIDVYTVENGKIVKVVIFSLNIDQENKFWGH